MFEYDQIKSQSNKEKHGIDFEQAQEVWNDPWRVKAAAKHVSGEPRWVMVGEAFGKLWTAVFTERNGNVRLILVRRSRNEEKSEYHQL